MRSKSNANEWNGILKACKRSLSNALYKYMHLLEFNFKDWWSKPPLSTSWYFGITAWSHTMRSQPSILSGQWKWSAEIYLCCFIVGDEVGWATGRCLCIYLYKLLVWKMPVELIQRRKGKAAFRVLLNRLSASRVINSKKKWKFYLNKIFYLNKNLYFF